MEMFQMGLLDGLKGALGGIVGQAEAELLPALLSKALAGTSLGSLQGLLDKLQQSGLGPQVASWLGNGANQPVTPDQIEAALGDNVIGKISATLNLPPDEVTGFLAAHLPTLINALSPHGTLQQPS
jgi:uncharacterized protein YidB (DUF937 family)